MRHPTKKTAAHANQETPAAALVKFNFHGDELDVVTTSDGEHHVVLARLCEPLGLADPWEQARKLEKSGWATTVKIPVVAADGKIRDQVCLSIRSVAGWLFTLNAGKVAPHLREKLALYQRECADRLADHFLGKRVDYEPLHPVFDVASVGDLVRTIVMESMRVIANEVRGDIAAFRGAAMTSSGTITGVQADDIRRAVVYCALAKATLGDRNFGSARKSFNNMLAGAIGWGGTARQLHLMPASKYPDAMALMRAIRIDLDHRLRAKGLPLPVVGGRQTEMFPIKDGAGQVKPNLTLVANNNRKKGVA